MERAASFSASGSAFHSDDLDEVAEYRSLSALAIVSLVFGLLSPVCAVHPFFMVIPLVGAALSIAALQRIAASEGALAGRWAAITALVFCVISAVATVSYGQVTRYLRTGQAEDFGYKWLDLLSAGKTEDAFRLTVEAIRRQPEPLPGEPEAKTNPFDEFIKNELVQSLVAAGEESRIEYVETVDYQPGGDHQYIVSQRFSVAPSTTADNSPIDVMLTLVRSQMEGETQMRWLVRSYERPGAADDAPPNG